MLETVSAQPALWYVFAGALGLAIGSFLNVVIWRYPAILRHQWRHECRALLGEEGVQVELPREADQPPPGLVRPASHCPHCGQRIRPWHNIPLLGFILLRGKCRDCGQPISWRYPAVELLTALVSLAVLWQLGFSGQAAVWLPASFLLIAMIGIDLQHRLLPDTLTLSLLWLGLLASATGVSPIAPADAVIGAASGYLLLWGFYHLFRLVTGKHGMGYGDFKLLAGLGALLGWSMLPIIILVASLTGAVTGVLWLAASGRGRHTPIPFGPFLALAGWVALFFGPGLQQLLF